MIKKHSIKLHFCLITAIFMGLIYGCGHQSSPETTPEIAPEVSASDVQSSKATSIPDSSESSSLATTTLDSNEAASEITVEEAKALSIPGLTVDTPEYWSLISINDALDEAKYEADLDGKKHEFTIKKIEDIPGFGDIFDDSRISDPKKYSEILNSLCEEYDMDSDRNSMFNHVYAPAKILQILWWKQGRTPIGFILSPEFCINIEADSFDIYDDVIAHCHIDNVEDIYIADSATAAQAGFKFYHTDSALSADAGNNTGKDNTTEASGSEEKTKNSTVQGKLGAVPPGLNGFKYWEDGDESIDLTDRTTVITDNNPNYTIIKNGPGQVIRSAYPYIGTPIYPYHMWADMETEAITMQYTNIDPSNIWDPVYVRSTDKYGCPYKVDISGDIYTKVYDPTFYTIEWRIDDNTGWDTINTSAQYKSEKTGEIYNISFTISMGYPGEGKICLGEDITKREYTPSNF